MLIERDSFTRACGLTLAFALWLSQPALAETQADLDLACKSVGDLAQAVMKKRQEGFAMSDLMAAAANAGDGADLARTIIIAAFQRPRMSVAENQQREIEDFRATYETGCYLNFKDRVTK